MDKFMRYWPRNVNLRVSSIGRGHQFARFLSAKRLVGLLLVKPRAKNQELKEGKYICLSF